MAFTPAMISCLLAALPGPPGAIWDGAYFQKIPIAKFNPYCSFIDSNRDITFNLYTRKNPSTPQILKIGEDKLFSDSNFDINKPTAIYLHGFLEGSVSYSANLIRKAYMHRGDHNLIIVGAMRLVAGPWYLTAVTNTRVIGLYVAQFIDYLVRKYVNLESIHVIGLSLGAQMAGVAGANVQSGKLSRITGLDPALPGFGSLSPEYRLDVTDANFVDVIHSDSGVFGFATSIGHADFFPNAGRGPQPGCKLQEMSKIGSIIERVFCSHWRAFQLYAESLINETRFPATHCISWEKYILKRCQPNVTNPIEYMGYRTSTMAHGNYYLQAQNLSRFAKELF